MRDFHDCSASDGAQRLLILLARLTVTRPAQAEPLELLEEVARRLLEGDALGVYRSYHALTEALMRCGARRVSGDLWNDYLLSLVVEQPHAFAADAARGVLDEAEQLAMKSDLATLGELAALDCRDIPRMAQERLREIQLRPRHAKDDISLMSAAVWSGSAVTPPAKEEPKPRPAMPFPVLSSLPGEGEWLAWHYGDSGLRDEYAADEVLEEIYIRLLKSPDWRAMCDDLWSLFASSGCGIFLRSRALRYQNGTFVPLAQKDAYCPVDFQEKQRTALTEHVIRFMRGEFASPVVLSGPEGCGKTELMLSLPGELPELRLVVVDGASPIDAHALYGMLGAQPLRFLLLFDGADPSSPWIKPLLCACKAGGSANVLPAATCKEPGDRSIFPFVLNLAYPQLSEFVSIVCDLLEFEGVTADKAWVRNACIDCQVDAREKLTMSAARMTAEKYKAAFY